VIRCADQRWSIIGPGIVERVGLSSGEFILFIASQVTVFLWPRWSERDALF
jgi:hypothetical protein